MSQIVTTEVAWLESLIMTSFSGEMHDGEPVTLLATMSYIGRTSVEVGINVVAESLKGRPVRHTNT
jgi:acyl-CoA hydrolase